MRKLLVFNHISLDGYFADANGEMSWAKAHNEDAEWNEFVGENASGGATLVFGRMTYELMAGFWPTPVAHENMPVVAERMNNLPKVVFSRTLNDATWNNTTLIKGDLLTEVRRMKQKPGNGMAILGSGSIVSQLARAGLIDEYQVVVNPIVLGSGRTMFESVHKRVNLGLVATRAFRNGNVYLCYRPIDETKG
jgi:dihydrofolate reductase